MLRDGVNRAAGALAAAFALIVVLVLVPVLALALNLAAANLALAQDAVPAGRQANAPGQFDFYVLALSWSPSYCAAAAERAPGRKADPQCGGRPFAFVVHGLWPQYEHGFPAFCQVPPPRLDRAVIGVGLELMPSPGLVIHEWDRHGTCTGLAPGGYFDAVRKARAAVKIPPDYLDLAAPILVSPDALAEAFVKINPGLTRAEMAVVCDKTRLSEIRICMSKDFSFRDCAEVARRGCTRDKIAMPAVRGATQ
jgi:ribonuclease T2